jgi:hypothetical protein
LKKKIIFKGDFFKYKCLGLLPGKNIKIIFAWDYCWEKCRIFFLPGTTAWENIEFLRLLRIVLGKF